MSKRRSNKDVKVAQSSANDTGSADVETSLEDVSADTDVDTAADMSTDPQTQDSQTQETESVTSQEFAEESSEESQQESAQADVSEDTSEPVASSVEHADEPVTELVQAVSDEELALQVEVALMTTDRAMPAAKLSDILGKVGVKAVNQSVKSLNETYQNTGRSFRIEEVANGLQILTLPKYAGVMELLHKTRTAGKLTPAAMETLAIIAYKQPILRVQIEAIRGVASGEMVRSLMERRLVKITGRSEDIGRPMLYGTTKTFLETFGLSSLKDLPKAEDFASGKGL